ncbi:TetR/AcrR family transcriptional regulator [Streptomyces sp. WI04-05B]|uniref:TetR/AcrR family transcriptional regulator n=1 Tax=Streptomyces TaxID=1883 RepID=UPI0029A2331B|nr:MULTISPECIES: TetR/AcrR family transcriptional regulator [unclassified Streptomyces]MDX2545360.1 TetR/AcrR family transcriptional regulator [Streptomyces sp. WI04-05B]MDX2588145.1 TetR/AcrR family transcriptional regulator [Streptomyces sp. WI04-05A]
MTTNVKPSPRERLLEAAATLTYRDGVGIGVEALCKAAGVSKRSMYQLFESKDELLAASLKERAAVFAARALPPADDGRSPRERILYVFERVESQAGAPDFQGCRYLAVQIELKDQAHPASRVAHRIKANLTAFFRSEAERAGVGNPDLLARQLILVFDGASARAGIGADSLTGLVTPTVTALLDAAGMPSSAGPSSRTGDRSALAG